MMGAVLMALKGHSFVLTNYSLEKQSTEEIPNSLGHYLYFMFSSHWSGFDSQRCSHAAVRTRLSAHQNHPSELRREADGADARQLRADVRHHDAVREPDSERHDLQPALPHLPLLALRLPDVAAALLLGVPLRVEPAGGADHVRRPPALRGLVERHHDAGVLEEVERTHSLLVSATCLCRDAGLRELEQAAGLVGVEDGSYEIGDVYGLRNRAWTGVLGRVPKALAVLLPWNGRAAAAPAGE